MIALTHLDLMFAGSIDQPPTDWIASQPEGAWSYTEKIDGIRVLAADGRLITRNGYDITGMFPEVAAPDDWWLDSEIAVVDAKGRSDFEATNRRAKGGHGGDAVLHVFDVLAVNDRDLRGDPYHSRFLCGLFDLPRTDSLRLLPVYEDGQDIWDRVVTAAGGEGIIARRPTSVYTGGRSTAMVKVKNRQTIDAIVIGRKEGKGGRESTFGALQLALIDDTSGSGFRSIGDVGSGFSNADIVDVMELLAANKPFVIEVSSLGFTSTGKLRQPVFHRIRTDVDALSCIGGDTG